MQEQFQSKLGPIEMWFIEAISSNIKIVIATSEPKGLFLLTILQRIFCLAHDINYRNHQIVQNTSVFVCLFVCCCRISAGNQTISIEVNRIEQYGPARQGGGVENSGTN